MKKILVNLMFALMLMLVLAPVLTTPVLAADDLLGLEYGENLELGNKDPRDIATNLVKVILGFLGIIAVIIILIGGFKWMIAGGNEEQVGEARKILISGVIGLAIILAAWGIATLVINSLIEATGTGA